MISLRFNVRASAVLMVAVAILWSTGCGEKIPGPSPFPPEKRPWWQFLGDKIKSKDLPLELTDVARSIKGYTNLVPTKETIHLVLPDNMINPMVLREYTKKTGIGFKLSVVESAESVRVALRNDSVHVDLALVSLRLLQEFKNAKELEPLDLHLLTNLHDLDWPEPTGKKFTRDWPFDPGNHYSVPYLWTIIGIAFNRASVTETIHSYRQLIDPRSFSRKIQSNLVGRITMLRDDREVLAAALLTLGENPNSTNRTALTNATRLLLQQQPFLAGYPTNSRGYETLDLVRLMAEEKVVMAQILSGDATYAIQRNPRIGFVTPKEGCILNIYSYVIPKGKSERKKSQISEFLNYLLNPVVAAAVSNFSRFATTSQQAKAFVADDIRRGPAYAQPELGKDFTLGPVDSATVEIYHESFALLTNSISSRTSKF